MNHNERPVIRFCPLCGTATENKNIYGEVRPNCPNCHWTFYEDPKVAAAVLIRENGSVLLTRRIFEPHKGDWTLPAGFVNAYEDPQDAAIRECLEETGLKVRITGLIDVIGGREHPRGADMVIVYQAEIIGGNLHAGDDADQVAFFPIDQLPALAFRATRVILGKENNLSNE